MTKVKPTYEDFALNALGFSDEEDASWLADRMAVNPGDLVAGRRVEEELGALSALAPEAAPTDDLFSAIEARLDSEASENSLTVRAEGGEWFERTKGVWCKILNEHEAGVTTRLLRCEAGSVVPSHRHYSDEELFMLEGDLRIGTLHLGKGDYHLARAASEHVDAVTENGCLVLVRG